MKITSIKKKKHIQPLSGSGTGYSEPDVFEATTDNGTSHKMVVDIWYLSPERIKPTFRMELLRVFGSTCENTEEAYSMYVDEIAETSCPYTKEELLSFSNK